MFLGSHDALDDHAGVLVTHLMMMQGVLQTRKLEELQTKAQLLVKSWAQDPQMPTGPDAV